MNRRTFGQSLLGLLAVCGLGKAATAKQEAIKIPRYGEPYYFGWQEGQIMDVIWTDAGMVQRTEQMIYKGGQWHTIPDASNA